MSKSDRRTLEFEDLDQVLEEVHRLDAGGYTRLGNWSLGQCCNHLALAMETTVDRYALRLPPPISTIGRTLFFGASWVPVLLGKLRLPTLPGFGQKEPIDDAEGISRLVDAISRVKSATAADLQPNPLLGRLSKDQWLQFHAFHAQRHLGFLIPKDESASQNQVKEESAAIAS